MARFAGSDLRSAPGARILVRNSNRLRKGSLVSSLKNKNPAVDKMLANVASVSGNIETPLLSIFFFFYYASKPLKRPDHGFRVQGHSFFSSQFTALLLIWSLYKNPLPTNTPTQIKPQSRVRHAARPSHVTPINSSHGPACHHGNCRMPSCPCTVPVRQ